MHMYAGPDEEVATPSVITTKSTMDMIMQILKLKPKKKKKCTQRPRILIVDDDELFTKSMQRVLEYGDLYDVRVVHRARQAYDAAVAFRPQLVFLDVMLPDGDGGEVASELLGDWRFRDTPIVFLTGAVKHDDLNSHEGTIGGRLYLAKPVKPETLIEWISSIIGVEA
jgi:chemotaxis family two-component system response regulator PixG